MQIPYVFRPAPLKGRYASPRQLLFISLTALHRDVRFDASAISYTDISRPTQTGSGRVLALGYPGSCEASRGGTTLTCSSARSSVSRGRSWTLVSECSQTRCRLNSGAIRDSLDSRCFARLKRQVWESIAAGRCRGCIGPLVEMGSIHAHRTPFVWVSVAGTEYRLLDQEPCK